MFGQTARPPPLWFFCFTSAVASISLLPLLCRSQRPEGHGRALRRGGQQKRAVWIDLAALYVFTSSPVSGTATGSIKASWTLCRTKPAAETTGNKEEALPHVPSHHPQRGGTNPHLASNRTTPFSVWSSCRGTEEGPTSSLLSPWLLR